MKQKVEEAYSDYGKIMFGDNKVWNKIAHDSFVAGAEWQAKQSPWISVEERLPEDDSDYIVLLSNGIIGVGIYDSNEKIWNINGIGIVRNVFLWMPIAHLDHTPENCDPSNLRALCQRCHNQYDAKHRAETRKKGGEK